jgi:hypothetical protein
VEAELVEGPRGARLELENVPGLRRLEQADRDRVKRAAEVAAERIDAPLAPGRRVEVLTS